MTLRQYLKKRGLSPAKFGEEVGYSRQNIERRLKSGYKVAWIGTDFMMFSPKKTVKIQPVSLPDTMPSE